MQPLFRCRRRPAVALAVPADPTAETMEGAGIAGRLVAAAFLPAEGVRETLEAAEAPMARTEEATLLMSVTMTGEGVVAAAPSSRIFWTGW